jgi:hypothetical protein
MATLIVLSVLLFWSYLAERFRTQTYLPTPGWVRMASLGLNWPGSYFVQTFLEFSTYEWISYDVMKFAALVVDWIFYFFVFRGIAFLLRQWKSRDSMEREPGT